jgi:hypothetical protein
MFSLALVFVTAVKMSVEAWWCVAEELDIDEMLEKRAREVLDEEKKTKEEKEETEKYGMPANEYDRKLVKSIEDALADQLGEDGMKLIAAAKTRIMEKRKKEEAGKSYA